jgi:hypothetical protein
MSLPCPAEQRLDQHREDRLGEIEADEEGHGERRDAPQQPAAKLDQMIEQRRLGSRRCPSRQRPLSRAAASGRRLGGGGPRRHRGISARRAGRARDNRRRAAWSSRMIRSFSSRHFFSISSSSASRIIFSMPEVKWRAMPRTRPTQRPTVRITLRQILGPDEHQREDRDDQQLGGIDAEHRRLALAR